MTHGSDSSSQNLMNDYRERGFSLGSVQCGYGYEHDCCLACWINPRTWCFEVKPISHNTYRYLLGDQK